MSSTQTPIPDNNPALPQPNNPSNYWIQILYWLNNVRYGGNTFRVYIHASLNLTQSELSRFGSAGGMTSDLSYFRPGLM